MPTHPSAAPPTASSERTAPYSAPADTPSSPSAPPPAGPTAPCPFDGGGDPAGDVVRWAAFSCLLVPVVLVVYGASVGGAATAALGLAAVTAACRVLLRHSERNAARAAAAGAPERTERTGGEARPRGRHSAGSTTGE
ncbi:hypothetical protein [Streptomyces qinzhouensis]|uniref:Uncharacterized protein n=1 Tax=Streptomyces qinzhouensis TaxID=2599401 RepID=A0A5B8IFE6_9ACTN|nr:hypothetical protein [Streptomyces qinzhouensis]QDY76862.1 hypothetical protein FQU76_10350 [Streptomyces qinzhouensis]